MRPRSVALAHGGFNVATGLWALLHLRSFEAVTGPKTDHWLVRAVAALVVVNGVAQLTAGDARHARTLGIGTAGSLAAIDLSYAPRGVIGPVYLLDAALELGWVAAWLRARD
ncbi:MAG TPA: hypothetical protein VFS29_13670 [Motilibacteraceae bacterium]|nr:hypothetical protein [Motilibacteraceae bacterium]